MAKNTSPLEREEAKILAKWLDTTGLLFSHVANENKSKMQAILNHQMGVRGGVPDYLVITPKGLLFIELKRKKGGVVSPEQAQWIEALNKIPNIQAVVCRGHEEAQEFVKHFL